MPTIEVKKAYLDRCLKSIKEAGVGIEEALSSVKAEIKGEDADYYKIDVADTNRPDLFTAEGIVKELQGIYRKEKFDYSFLNQKPSHRIEVLDSVREIRPFVGAFLVKGLTVDEDSLDSLIKMQEKLCETLGRKRRRVAIGVYEASAIKFPVRYGAFGPKSYRFVPLGLDDEMDLKDILKKHPKGIEYGHLLKDFSKYPLLLDANDEVLSLPPIINSKKMGEVKIGSNYLFVEATGLDQRAVTLALNIISFCLSFRGGTIERCESVYPYSTPFGENQVTPMQMNKALRIDMKEPKRILGVEIGWEDAAEKLMRLGYEIHGRGENFQVIAPYYRSDCMHQYDIIEDIAIVKGYNSFAPLPLTDFTMGSLSREQEEMDNIRDILVGMGFQEIISNILVSRAELYERMRQEQEAVEIENVMTESYSILRNWLIPGLVKVESNSSQIEYPHRIFEVGEVVLKEDEPRAELRLACLMSGREINFTDVHRTLESLLETLSLPYKLQAAPDHSFIGSFIEGRFGTVEVNGKEIGIIGELHPEVLYNWSIKMPASALEITLPSNLSCLIRDGVL
ncbi:phenylalanine--tRNA ligase subunit beta [candidate division NPL-UPA2 bacterium]|nr:phenylalanine--tRNA ligase subunit beta [candidate division NPL-UPA2 bacterium]